MAERKTTTRARRPAAVIEQVPVPEQPPHFRKIEVTVDELLAKVGRYVVENEKLTDANNSLVGEIGRMRALCEKHGVDPDELP